MNEELTEFSEQGHFKFIDYAIFISLIVISVVIGLVVGFREWGKATTKDFLVGGRKMHPIPVAMSLIGGVVSALSVIGNATEMYLYGTQLALNIVGCFYGTLVVMFLILPTLYPLELISMMQYLELRFDSTLLKKIGSLDQMLNMCLYLGICLYTPSLTLASVTNFSTWSSIVILGLVCTVYISIGGVKAVVYTDVFQTSIMFVGVLAVIIVVCLDLGGISTVFSIAEAGGRFELFNLDPSPFVRHTFWNVQILGLYFVVSVVGLAQPQFQRLNSVKSLKISQGLCIMFYFGLVILWSLFYFTGIVAYAAYADCDPLASNKIEKPDQIIPYMIADKLVNLPGMAGLFVAAVYGAVLSSVSSSASAFAALVWEDFLCDWIWFRKSIKISPTNITRILTAIAGLIGIGFAFLVGSLGTIFQVAYTIIGAVIGPLNGLFVTAIAAPWVTEKGAIFGFISAFVFNMWLVVGQFMHGAGKTDPLPLSTDGCPMSLFNSSSLINVDDPSNFTSAPLNSSFHVLPETDAFIEDNFKTGDYMAIYDISYCYFGTIGVLIVFIVSSLVSFLTDPIKPDDVNPKLVHHGSLKIYKWLWNRSRKGKQHDITSEDKIAPTVTLNSLETIKDSLELDTMKEPLKNGTLSELT